MNSVGWAPETVGEENILRFLSWEKTAHLETSSPQLSVRREKPGLNYKTADILESVSIFIRKLYDANT